MKTIALIDPFWDGHHEIYFKTITRACLELGYRVIAFCPEPQALQAWVRANLQSHLTKIDTFELHRPVITTLAYAKLPLLKKLHHAADILEHWKDAARSIQYAASKVGNVPDLVFFLWIDSYLSPYFTHHLVDRVFPYKWSGLYFQPTHLRQERSSNLIRGGVFPSHGVFRSPYCQSVAILDEGITEVLQAALKQKPVIAFPDFADASTPDYSFELVRTIQEKARGRKIIGLLGALGKHKGFLTMLRMAKAMEQEDWFFVFAGQLTRWCFSESELAEIDQAVQSNPHNCLFYLERIPGEPQFNAVISTCDALFALYAYCHSSNILTKAAIFEKPVLSSNQFCMGERVQRHKLGVAASPSSLSENLIALRSLAQQLDTGCSENFKFVEYRNLHSIAQLYTQLRAVLKDA